MNTLQKLKLHLGEIVGRMTIPLAIILSFGFIFYACSEYQNPVSELSVKESIAIPTASVTGVNEDPVVINNFEIKFNGSTYNNEGGSETTTFSYTVSRGDDGTGFNYMLFEVPSCAELNDYSPLESSSITDDGIKWTSSIGANSSRVYEFTYSGKILTGMVDATIQASGSGDIVTKLIPGPCKGIYSISGVAYVDENGNQIVDAGEGGIEDVTVHIVKDGTDIASENTSSDGSYLFNVYTGDVATDFKIQVRSESNSNTFLFDDFTPTNPTEVTLTVNNEDIAGLNFGFKAETEKIIEEFENEIIKLRTDKPAFWADEFKFSDKGKSTVFTKAQLLGYLNVIDGMDLKYKFDFGSGDDERIKTAQDILTVKRNSTDLELLLAELLAAKLNVGSGNGAVDDNGDPINEFNNLILKTGAAAAVALDPDFSSSSLLNGITNETITFTSSITTRNSNDLLSAFNGGGGGVGPN
jgi:hypothetical protein